ncbi:MAG: PAS domain S-box protein, partial [Verrucomicrobia bacterium]|nr:PAS domain S-box protein [Verrucomicrobiota bacterium]
SLVNFWTQHLRTGFPLVRRAFDAAQEAGDLTYATYARYDLIGQLLLSGDPLAEVQRDAELAVQLAKKARFGPMVDGTTVQLRLIRMLRGLTPEFGSLNDEQFDEAQFEQRLEGDACLANSACRYWIRKLEAQFYAARYGPAVGAAENAQRFLWAMPPTIELTDYHFHAALARAAYCREASAVERRRQMEALVAHHRQLTIWAENCPMNFGNYAAVIGAEIARIEGRQLDAERLYEEAIQSAHKNGFVNDEAIANEAAAKFYLDRGLGTIAHSYLRNAFSCYLRWGADAKAKHLEQLYGRADDTAFELASTAEPLLDRLDLRMVVKALQAVSREINLAKLIETLMVTALEHAGAERGLLILTSANEQRIATEAKTVREIVTVDLRQTVITSTDVPESILRYVSRMQKGLILNDASVHNLFSDDEYFRRRNCRSILCVPLVKQGELAGFLYLENNLTPQVFTPERLAALELLASQAAISLENAQLYAGLRRENIDRSKAEQSLRESEERWRRLFENSSAGIALIDSDGCYITANLALQRMLGYTEAELQGLTASEITHEEDRARTEEIIAETIAGERREYRIEKRYRRKDGGVVWADVSTAFVPASKDMPAFFSAVVVDVTERKQAETEARKHREELAHLSRVAMMGEMAGSLAHELNQPLTGIVNYASAGRRFIAKGRGEISKLDGLFEAVVEDGRRAGEIIRGIRGMIQKGKEIRGPLDINDLIAGVLRLVHSDALEHNCLVMTDLGPESPLVEGDKVQLQQVLLNLIVNAFEAMKETPLNQRRVIIKERQSDGRAIVSVRDFGAGLPLGDPQRIFEQFFSTKRNGMGMGLAIVRSIIVSHDGELGAENAEGGGARVHFSLPIIAKG